MHCVLRTAKWIGLLSFAWIGLAAQTLHTVDLTTKTDATGRDTIVLQPCRDSFQRNDSDTLSDSLVIRFRDKAGNVVTAPITLLMYAGNVLLDSIVQARASEFAVNAAKGSLSGKLLEVTAARSGNYVCSVMLGEKRNKNKLAEGFMLLTGAEISSAQSNFSSTNTRFAASASWEFPLAGDTGSGRLLFTAVVSVTSALQVSFGKACQPGLQRVFVGPNIANIQPPGTPCGIATIKDSTLTATIPTAAAIGYQTARSVRVVGTVRKEFHIPDTRMYLGPALSLGLQTNPDSTQATSTPLFIFFGGTLRQLFPASTRSLFRLDVGVGFGADFADTVVQAIPVQAQSTSFAADTLRTPAAPGRTFRFRYEIRLLAEPISGFSVRGFARLSSRGPDLVQLAVLKEIDVEQVLNGLLGKTKS